MRVLLLLAATAAAVVAGAPAAGKPPPPPPPSPHQDALEKQYAGWLNASCGAVLAHVPALPAADAASFMTAYQAFNGNGSEAAVLHLASVLLEGAAVRAFLALPDSFGPGGLDAAMVRCAVLFEGTPLGLAQFAAVSAAQEALVGSLLNDTLLMRDMLVAGGPAGSAYGPAMAIYTSLTKASAPLRAALEAAAAAAAAAGAPWDSRNQSTVLARLALGTALGHAVPIKHRYDEDNVDPVARYLHYERAYLAGDLDPALEVLTAFECFHTTDADSTDADLLWLRHTMGNYRPDHIAMDYSWRYSRAVRTEVAYGDPQCALMPGVCDGHYAQIPAAGGECGPRAFFGRFARKAFGLPTWGVTQPGHAAMTCWAPEGWHVLLGADWEYSWWRTRGGEDFHLEAQCRELRPAFQQVLRGGWAANALGEAPVDPNWTPRTHSGYGAGGVWSALMLYAKKLAVNATQAPPRAIGPPVVPSKVAALIARWPQKVPAPNVTTGPDGTITVPAAAYALKNRSAAVAIMPSYDAGEQVLHSGADFLHPAASSFGYEVTVPEAHTAYLTANITTWHMNQDLLLATNATPTARPVPVYYTVGHWNQTQPIPVQLVEGRNVLTFTRTTPRELALKEFFLYKTKPVVPAPPKNHTPSPVPPASSYIELPATTTCLKQGISEVPEQFCGRACETLGLTFTGAKPRANMTGCFALADGQWKGNCNFNSNKSAVCANPPCTVEGSTAQAICIRK